jgi:phosphatidylglycerophosphatase C
LDRGGLKGAILHCLFGNMPRQTIDTWARQYAAMVVPAGMFTEALAAFRAHLAGGDHVVLLSASPDLFVPGIARLLGAHDVICTEVLWKGELLDGRLAGPNRRDHEKARVLADLRVRMPELPVIAYGNSAPDLIHMQHCEQAVYVNPSPALAAQLARQGMRCVQWR